MKYTEVLKETYPGSGAWTHSHWIDENGNIVPDGDIVVPVTEYEALKQSNADMSSIIEDAIMRGVL